MTKKYFLFIQPGFKLQYSNDKGQQNCKYVTIITQILRLYFDVKLRLQEAQKTFPAFCSNLKLQGIKDAKPETIICLVILC